MNKFKLVKFLKEFEIIDRVMIINFLILFPILILCSVINYFSYILYFLLLSLFVITFFNLIFKIYKFMLSINNMIKTFMIKYYEEKY